MRLSLASVLVLVLSSCVPAADDVADDSGPNASAANLAGEGVEPLGAEVLGALVVPADHVDDDVVADLDLGRASRPDEARELGREV